MTEEKLSPLEPSTDRDKGSLWVMRLLTLAAPAARAWATLVEFVWLWRRMGRARAWDLALRLYGWRR